MDGKTLERIVETIVELLQPERVILFGSHARGEQVADSDLDLAVVADVTEPRQQCLARVRRALPNLQVGLDLVLFTPQEWAYFGQVRSSFQAHIRETGAVQYERGGSATRVGAGVV